MRLVFGLVLVVGLGLAGFAVYMAKNYISQTQAQLAQERANRAPVLETVDVYVASENLQYGQQLLKEHVKLVTYPKSSLPEGVYSTEEELFPQGDEKPRRVMRAMEPHEAIMAVKVTKPGEEAGITSQLAPGMRAFALKVDVASGVSGFLRPGDRVDIYWTGQVNVTGVDNDVRNGVTKLIDTGVRLIAVDQVANGDTTEAIIARTITVAVTPQQVAGLAQAQSTGRLALSLVGAGDESVSDVIEVNQRDLLGIAQVVEEAPQEIIRPEICTIKSRRGGEVIETPIPCATN